MTKHRPSWRLTKAAWNERIKLLATSVNAVGLALFGFGVLGPMFSAVAAGSAVQTTACTAILVMAHFGAQWLLRWLED